MRAGSFGTRGYTQAAQPFSANPYDIAADARATYAAERAEAPDGWSGPDWRGKLRGFGSGLAIVAGLLAYVVFSNIVHPVHYWDAVTLVGIAVVPVEAALMFFFAEDHPLAARNLFKRAFAGNPLGWLETLAIVGMFGIGVPAGLFLFANERLDGAPPTTEVLPVQMAWTHTHRSSTSYYVGVAPAAHPPSSLFSFYDLEPVRVSQHEYDETQPGRSTLTLRVHPGRFGLSWYEATAFKR